MKNKAILALLLAGCMVCSLPAMSFAETEAVTEEAAEEAAEEAPAEEAAPEEQAEEAASDKETLSDDLYSFSVQIGEDIYQFPMTYAAFVEKGGWAVTGYYEGQEEDMLVPDSYTFMGLEKDGNKISLDVINYDINEVKIADCYAGGIQIDAGYDFNAETVDVVLPGGIKLGAATLEEIEAAYGSPSDIYEGDLYTKLTYEKDFYEEVELYVYKEPGVLQEFEIRNFSTPEDFVQGEVSTEVPEAAASYVTPEALTDDYTDPVVEYFGDLYRLPVPVSAMEANGWVIEDAKEDAFVKGGGIAFVDMIKDNQSVHFAIYNDSNNATAYSNCMIHEMKFFTYDNEIIDMKLSGGVSLGADADELMAAAKENGYYVEDEIETGYLTVAKSDDVKYDNYVEFWINTDENAVAIAGMTCRCEK